MATELLTSAWAPENFYETTLSADCTDVDTDIFLTGVPTNSEGTLIIDPDSSTNREIIYYSSKTATKVVCPANGRGYDGSTATSHTSGTKVIMAPIADWYNSIKSGNVLENSSITTAKIADDAVTAAKIDWASTGASAGIWWEEIGRTTLSSAGDTITVSSISARKYLKLLIYVINTGGTINGRITFNNDTAANYANRYSLNGGADTTETSNSTGIPFKTTVAEPAFAEIVVINVSAQEKLATGSTTTVATAGAATAPSKLEISGKWVNTSNQITRVDVTNTGTGDFAIGSEVVVLGHD